MQGSSPHCSLWGLLFGGRGAASSFPSASSPLTQQPSLNLFWWFQKYCKIVCVLSRFTYVQLFATIWTVAHQTPLSMGISRQEHWSKLPHPPPVPRIGSTSLASPALARGFFTTSTTWEAVSKVAPHLNKIILYHMLQILLRKKNFFYYYFFIVLDFVIHWNETAMGLHVFPIPIPPPTSRKRIFLKNSAL